MRRFVVLTQIIAVLCGCQISTDALKSSSSSKELSKATASAIADDIVGQLAEQIGQSGGTIYLKKNDETLGQALTKALTDHGYATTIQPSDRKNPAIPFTYDIDQINGQRLLEISVGNIILARSYSTTANGAVPASAVSIMRKDG